MNMVFTNVKTETKLAPAGFNPVTMMLKSGANKALRSTTQSAPATMKFSDLSSLKRSRGCASCGGR